VVIGTIISLAGTILIFGYLAYRFFKIIATDKDEE